MFNLIDRKIRSSDVKLNQALDFQEDFSESVLIYLNELGWITSKLFPSDGQGIDILAIKDGVKVAIHVVTSAYLVGVEHVQQTFAGAAFHDASIGIIFSHSNFSENSINLAKKLRVLLLNKSDLNILENFI